MGGRKSVVCVLSSRDHRGQPERIPTASFTLPHRGRACRTLLSPRLRARPLGDAASSSVSHCWAALQAGGLCHPEKILRQSGRARGRSWGWWQACAPGTNSIHSREGVCNDGGACCARNPWPQFPHLYTDGRASVLFAGSSSLPPP